MRSEWLCLWSSQAPFSAITCLVVPGGRVHTENPALSTLRTKALTSPYKAEQCSALALDSSEFLCVIKQQPERLLDLLVTPQLHFAMHTCIGRQTQTCVKNFLYSCSQKDRCELMMYKSHSLELGLGKKKSTEREN